MRPAVPISVQALLRFRRTLSQRPFQLAVQVMASLLVALLILAVIRRLHLHILLQSLFPVVSVDRAAPPSRLFPLDPSPAHLVFPHFHLRPKLRLAHLVVSVLLIHLPELRQMDPKVPTPYQPSPSHPPGNPQEAPTVVRAIREPKPLVALHLMGPQPDLIVAPALVNP